MSEVSKQASVIKVCHVAMGDLWAGAEVQLLALMKYGVRLPGFEWTVVLFNEGKLADELRKLPISLAIISEKNHSPIAIAYRLARKFRQVQPDIVHTHKYKDSIIGSLVARCLRVPYVVRVIHGMPEPFQGLKNLKMFGYTLADRFVTRFFIDKIVAVSSDIEKLIGEAYGADRVVCIHNGVDLEAMQVTFATAEMRKEWRFDETEVVIGTVGRLVPVKGHIILLEALRILHDSHQNVRLLVIGEGPLRSHLEAEVKRLGLKQVVTFAGHKEQAYDFINMMDIFALPSLHEGIPMVLLEALALKRPVIASRVGGIPEVVLHGHTGLLIDHSNPAELAAGLKIMLQDRSRAAALGMAGRIKVAHEFNALVMASKTCKMYQELRANALPNIT